MIDGLGQRIAARREAIGMTAASLAKVTGLSFQRVLSLESPASFPTLGEFVKIAQALRLSCDSLLGGPMPKPSAVLRFKDMTVTLDVRLKDVLPGRSRDERVEACVKAIKAALTGELVPKQPTLELPQSRNSYLDLTQALTLAERRAAVAEGQLGKAQIKCESLKRELIAAHEQIERLVVRDGEKE